MKKTFSKFGLRLEDPVTGLKLNYPESYKATYNYGKLPSSQNKTPDEEQILKQSWSNRFTSSSV